MSLAKKCAKVEPKASLALAGGGGRAEFTHIEHVLISSKTFFPIQFKFKANNYILEIIIFL